MKIKFYNEIFGPVGLYEASKSESRDPEAILKEGEIIGNLANKRQCGLLGMDLSFLDPSYISDLRTFSYKAIIEKSQAEFLFFEKISPWILQARKVGFFGWPTITADGLFTSLDAYFKWQKLYKDEEIEQV